MQPTEAEGELKRMLRAEGFNISNLNPQIAWQVFKSFAQNPVECADDSFLFQCGVFDFTGKDLFYFDFVRQFSIDDENGEYDHMEHLHCEFTCPPDKELNQLKKNLWSYEFNNLNNYFTAVENLPEFQTAMNHQNWKCKIEQEEV